MATTPRPGVDESQWHIVERWQEYEGESRANFLRLSAVTAFYFIELLNYFGPRLGIPGFPQVVDWRFHALATCIVVAWFSLSGLILFLLRHRIFPWWLKYASTGGDAMLLTATLMLADRERSPLVAAYFILIAVSALRFSPRLVLFATGASVMGYVGLWSSIVVNRPLENVALPLYGKIMFLLSLIFSGAVIASAIRQARSMASDYSSRRQWTGEA